MLYHISLLARPDVQNAEKNDRGEEGEVSWQKSILVIILRLLRSSIDAYDGQKYITPPTISFVWILFGLLHRDPK